MPEFTKEQQKVHDAVRPFIASLLTKVNGSFGRMAVLGFIYGYTGNQDDPGDPFMMRFGNVGNEGEDFVYLCAKLGAMTTDLIEGGQVEVDILKPNMVTSESVADKLAVELMACPAETLPDQVKELLNQYLASRRGETNG